MSETQKISLLLVAILLLAIITPVAFTQATTITVPDDFSTIQEAVNAASPGDTIFVKAGTYQEKVTINKNNLALTGENKFTTIVDGGGVTDRAIHIENADNVKVSGFTIQNSQDGIFIRDSSFGSVSGNIITTCSNRGIILVSSSFITLSGNTMTNNHDSFELYKSSFSTVSGNTITNSRFGIGTSQSFNNTFSGNTITTCQQGIYMWDCSYTTVSGNTISNTTEHGISLVVSAYCSFFANTITISAMRGISIGNSTDCVVSGNTIKFTASQGIHTFYSSGHTISDNTLTSNYVGLGFYMSSDSTVFGNTISQGRTGITVTQASNNIFYHNSIVDNQYQVVAQNSINTWDDDYPSGGNYWSDYKGVDADGDGIGDTPYIINESNQDRYPLMEPFSGTPTTHSGDWIVDDDGPADFSTIQEAVNAASPGDTILVKSGTYYENVLVDKSIFLIGENSGNTIIFGDGSSSPVVRFSIVNNATISGFTVTNGKYGISVRICSYIDISGNIITNTGNNAIQFITSENNIVSGNTIISSGFSGVSLSSSNNSIISGNTITNSTGNGINLVNSINNLASGNTIKLILNGDGIRLDNCHDCVISENVISNSTFEGIYAVYSSGCTFSGCTITNVTRPISFLYSDNNIVSGNVIPNSVYGAIAFMHSDNNVASGNIITNSKYAGIHIDSCSHCSVYENTITNSADHGIRLDTSDNCIVSGNTITNSAGNGVYVRISQNNTVSGNNVINNNVGTLIYKSDDTVIYHNNFVDNTIQTSVTSSTSTWDDGYPSGGNYWSDYDGTDADGDGIGDTPYIIAENNQDSYPLMTPYGTNVSISYTLIVESVPSGVTFTADNLICVAPWSKTYNQTTLVTLTMPESYSYEGKTYNWTRWSDGDANRTKTVNVNKNIALTAVFTIEYVLPEIVVLSPENKTYTTTDVPLEFTVNTPSYVATYSLDGQENVTIVGNTTLTGLSEGPHNVVVYIEEASGKITASDPIYFTVATVSAGITILSPENKTYNTADVPLIYIKNETCLVSCFELDGQANYTEPGNTTLFGLSDGVHQLVMFVNYTDSFIGEEVSVVFTVNTTVPDTTPPIISVLSPVNTTYTSNQVPLNFTVNEQTDWMGCSLDGQENVTVTGNTTLTELSDGLHSLLVFANDTSGNTAQSDTTYFTVALPILGVTILSPENITYNTSDVPFGYLVNETCNNVTYSLDGQTFVDAENVTVLSGLADGAHELIVVANFTDNNVGESATVWFTVDTVPPTIAEVTILPATVNGSLEDGANVNATVTDFVSEINQVVLRFTTDNETWVTTDMTKLEADIWNGTLPGFPHDTNVTYIVVAEDVAGNTITSEELFGQPNQYQVLPEFMSWIILPILLSVVLLGRVYRKKLHKRTNQQSY